MEKTIKTVIHSYYFDTRNAEEKEKYQALKAKLQGMGLKCFETWGGKGHYISDFKGGLAVELETKHLFNNQWNTAPIEGFSELGHRVFDWAQDWPVNFSANIKKGHWIEQTPEMREIRRNTAACGYCGRQEPAAKGYVFCPHCLDSEYLKSTELRLTRMRPVDVEGDRAPLTEAETAYLMPLYREAQSKGSTERGKLHLAKFRKDVESKFRKATADAKTERDGFIRLMDLGIGGPLLSNCIFYSHTGKFGFGWRTPIETEMESILLDVISEFPFPYEIKCFDGRKLEGN